MQHNLKEHNEVKHFYIAKSPSLYSRVDEITFVKTRCDDASEIIQNTYDHVLENQFTTVIPFTSKDIPRRESKYLSFNGCIQPIVIEFDHCPIQLQQERILHVSEELRTPMFMVHSGNKSIHHYLFFKHFANSQEEYKRRCQQFVAYLAMKYPKYFKKPINAKEKGELIPDYKMFTGNRYGRQANGKRDNGKFQRAKVLHSIADGIDPIDLISLSDRIFMTGYSPVASRQESATERPEQKKPRKATLEFIAMGVEQGCRDDECYKAACDLRDCGYSKDEVQKKLLEGAKKCRPEFPESEVKIKLESAWNGNRPFDPIDKSKPYAFIERTTGAYWYLIDGRLFSAKKEVLKDIFKSYKTAFPDPFDVYKFKFDVHNNARLDRANRTFNLFTPTKYHSMSPSRDIVDPEADFPYINMLLRNLFVKDNERKHFINWFACALQTRKKLMTAYVLKGEQGAGKGLLFSYIIKPLFGEIQTMQVEDEQLKSPFNGYMKNVCFVAFNEVAHSNYGRNSLNSKIKSIITDPTITINEKFIQAYTIKNCVNCIFFSNESVPLFVERGDRRFNIVETGGALTGFKWFRDGAVIPELSMELENFAQYLWNIQNDIAKANKALNNDTKSTLIQAGSSRFEEFAHHLKAADVEWFLENVPNYYHEPIKENDLRTLPDGKIAKSMARKLFQGIYSDYGVTKNTLTKKLASCGITASKDSSITRTPIYKWPI